MTDAPSTPPEPPSLRTLLLTNIKVVGGFMLLALAAYGTWRLIAYFFPEISWLQIDD